MKKVTDKRTGLTWELQNKLKDNEFVDDVCLQTEKENHNMQRKYKNWRQNHKKIGLRIDVKKIKIFRNSNEQISQIKIKSIQKTSGLSK
jgi:hypothetical protein